MQRSALACPALQTRLTSHPLTYPVIHPALYHPVLPTPALLQRRKSSWRAVCPPASTDSCAPTSATAYASSSGEAGRRPWHTLACMQGCAHRAGWRWSVQGLVWSAPTLRGLLTEV